MNDDQFYEPKRPKPQFDIKWLVIGFAIMVCLRGGVQLYIEFAKYRVKKTVSSDGTPSSGDPRMDAAEKNLRAVEDRRDEIDRKIEETNQRLSALASKATLSAEEKQQKKNDEALVARLRGQQEEANENVTKANQRIDEVRGEKMAEVGSDVGTVFGASVGIAIAYGVFAPFSFFLGGLIVGWKSPGNTIMEPALAAIGATVVVTSWDFIGGISEGAIACLGCSSIFSFMIALVGAMIGEKIQGPASAQVNVNINKQGY